MKIIKIGREASNNFVVADDTVSRHHAELTVMDNGECQIKDLNSANGTFVNRKKLLPLQSAPVKFGDIVVLGRYQLDIQKAISEGSAVRRNDVAAPADAVISQKIGRSGSCDIRLEMDDVSSFHALLYRDKKGNVVVVDNHSTNGTFVNGKRVTEKVLEKGDKLTVGSHDVDWKQLRPKKKALFAGIAAAAAVLVAVGLFVFRDNIFPWGAKKIFERYQNSVVMVFASYSYTVTYNGEPISEYLGMKAFDQVYLNDGVVNMGETSCTGTGFYISKDGLIMTNRHVISPSADEETLVKNQIREILLNMKQPELAGGFEVKLKMGELCVAKNGVHLSTLNDCMDCTKYKVSKDENIDLAVIQLNTKQTPVDAKVVEIAKCVDTRKLKPGVELYSIGFPASVTIGQTDIGLEASNLQGAVTQERGEYIYGNSLAILAGASGSPVFNKYGKLAGVVVSGFGIAAQTYNHAINTDAIKEFKTVNIK